jgi:hypothetical protein
MRVNRYLLPLLVIVTLLGPVLIAQALGVWSTSGRTTVNLERLAPADIKGWMSLQQVIDGLNVPPATVYNLMHIPADIAPSTALKDLEGIVPDFEVTVLRDKLTTYLSANSPVEEATAEVTLAPTLIPTAEATPAPSQAALPTSAIKGKMTLRQVSAEYGIPLDALLKTLTLPADTNPDTVIKDLVEQGKLNEVSQVQDAVAAWQGK